jgi:alanyl-tRNA synthetase
VITHALDEATPEYLRLLAATLVAESKVVAFLASRSAGHVALAQTKGLAPADMGATLRQALKDFPGKGGGAKDFAQGSLTNPAQIEAFLKRVTELVAP